MAATAGSAGLSDYLALIDPALAPAVRKVHRAVRAAGAPLEAAVKWQMLTYAFKGDWRHWVCALDVGRSGMKGFAGKVPADRALHLRFLYGVLLDDPGGRLRAGSSILKTLDFPSPAEVDVALVTAFVRDAAERFKEFRASEHGPGRRLVRHLPGAASRSPRCNLPRSERQGGGCR